MLLFGFVQTIQEKTSVGLITANVFGGIIHSRLGSPSTNPVTAASEGPSPSRAHRGSQGPSGYQVALEESGMQEFENSLFGRAANETAQILTLRHSFSRLFSIVVEQKARAREVEPW